MDLISWILYSVLGFYFYKSIFNCILNWVGLIGSCGKIVLSCCTASLSHAPRVSSQAAQAHLFPPLRIIHFKKKNNLQFLTLGFRIGNLARHEMRVQIRNAYVPDNYEACKFFSISYRKNNYHLSIAGLE